MFKLYFLAGVTSEEELDAYKTTLEQLSHGEFKGLSFEKLRGYSHIYSIRDNQKGRLLISFPLINGERSLVILEVLPNHEYLKSRVLRSDIIRQYIADVKVIGEELVFEPLAKNADEVKQLLPPVSASPSPQLVAKPVHYYFSSCIEHSEKQAALIGIKAPQIITGPSGSGKSCVAVAKARALYNALTSLQAEGSSITYIAPTKALCAQVASSFNATRPENANDPVAVKFLTYEEWLGLDKGKLIGFNEFVAWLGKAQLRTYPHIKDWVNIKHKNRLTHIKKIYSEMQLIVAHEAQEYLGLGMRGSLYHQKDIRQELLTFTTHYVSDLQKETRCDVSLNPGDSDQSNATAEGAHYVLIDEAQSIPPVVLKLLIAHYGQHSYFFADSNQNTEMQLSVLPLLKQWLALKSQDKANSSLSTDRLEVCYRCPEAVMVAANWVLKLKQHLTQGLSDKTEMAEVLPMSRDFKGRVDIIKNEPGAIEKLNHRLSQKQLRCAVIAPTELIEQAQQAFPGMLVFTVQAIRGLQFEHIIGYGLFSTKEMQALNDKLRQLKADGFPFDPTAEGHKNLPKKEAASEKHFNTELNGLFVAFTRTMKSLWLVEDYEQHRCEFTAKSLLEYLGATSPVIESVESHSLSSTEATEATEAIEATDDPQSSPLAYLELVKQLLWNGNESQAQALFSRYHRGDAQDYDRLKRHLNLWEEASSEPAVTNSHLSSTSNSSSSSEPSRLTVFSTAKEAIQRQPRHRHNGRKAPAAAVALGSSTLPPEGTIQQLRSELYKLSLTEQSCKKIFKTYQNKIKKLPVEELCVIDPVDGVPPLYWMFEFHNGIVWLNRMLDEQIQKISVAALCAVHTEKKDSILNNISLDSDGRAWLSRMSDEQIKKIPVKALCDIHFNYKAPPLYWLASDSKGLELLGRLSDEQIKIISVKTLCATPYSRKTSQLYFLTTTPEGCAILCRLSEQQLKEIAVHPHFIDYLMRDRSIVDFMIDTDTGLKVLQQLHKYNPELTQKMNTERQLIDKITSPSSSPIGFFSPGNNQSVNHQQTSSSDENDLIKDDTKLRSPAL